MKPAPPVTRTCTAARYRWLTARASAPGTWAPATAHDSPVVSRSAGIAGRRPVTTASLLLDLAAFGLGVWYVVRRTFRYRRIRIDHVLVFVVGHLYYVSSSSILAHLDLLGDRFVGMYSTFDAVTSDPPRVGQPLGVRRAGRLHRGVRAHRSSPPGPDAAAAAGRPSRAGDRRCRRGAGDLRGGVPPVSQCAARGLHLTRSERHPSPIRARAPGRVGDCVSGDDPVRTTPVRQRRQIAGAQPARRPRCRRRRRRADPRPPRRRQPPVLA